MFLRVGGGAEPKKRDSLSDAVSQLALALSPNVSATTASRSSGSPAKLIDNRSKCYKQLSELYSLKLSGLLNEEEHDTEREAIMNVLKNLS